MPLLPLLADVTHGEWCRLVKKPPMPSMATKKKPPISIKKKPSCITEKKPSINIMQKPSVITKKKPSVATTTKKPSIIAKKKPSVITEKKPSVITEKKPSVITKKKPSVITKKKPSVVITTKKLSMNTKNSSMPSRDSRVLGLDEQQRCRQEALPHQAASSGDSPARQHARFTSTVTAQETDEETQYCIYCGASRREQGAVRCEACGIHN